MRAENEGFDSVFARQVGSVYRLCLLHLRQPADAEDAAQTVFLKYLRAGKGFHSETHERAWFLRGAQNVCKDMLRSAWWRRVRPVEEMREMVIFQEAEDDVLGQVWTLPETYRVVLYLHYYEGYQAKEIAGMLRRSQSTVRTQLARARELLKAKMEAGEENE